MTQPCLLIIEADLLIRTPLAEYLRECGFRVLEAHDAGEARQILAQPKTTVDVILADAEGAGESGFSFATWARRQFPNTNVVLAGTTARAAERAGEICAEGPALSKPYDHQLVLREIRRLLAARDR
jgi:DNA-binding response OmpR family regulator